MSKSRNKLIFHLFVGALLMLVYPWDSLFSGNQNVYFLWAAAQSGFGHLQADPLLSQADPFPAFTMLAQLIFSFLPIATFQIVYWLINVVYSYSIFGITDRFTGIYAGIRSLVLFTVLFLFFHSTQVWGTFFETAVGVDLRWVWDSGMAEQGLLRGYLQPSVFGVFLLLGVHFILRNKLIASALAFAVAGTMHANYLALSGLILGVITIYLLVKKQLNKKQIGAMALFVGLTLPYLIYVATHFLGDHSADVQTTVADHFDSHLHFDPSTWFNAKTGLQLIVFLVFIWMFRKTSFGRWIIGISTVTMLISGLTFLMPELPLISLTPWRISVVIFPISFFILLGLASQSLRPGKYAQIFLLAASAILVSLIYYRIMGSGDPEFLSTWKLVTAMFVIGSFLLAWFSRKLNTTFQVHLNNTAGLGLIFFMVFAAVLGKWMEHRIQEQFAWRSMQDHIHQHALDGELYLVPGSFTGFRMNAGVAVYSDNLLVHGETLSEQYDRISLRENFYSSDAESEKIPSTYLINEGITHVVVPVEQTITEGDLVFSDENYQLFKLR